MYYRKEPFLLLFIFFLLSISVSAQAVLIRGNVSDSATGDPLVGAIITIDSANSGVTDANGQFTVRTYPGDHLLTFRYTGYQILGKYIVVTENDTSELSIQLVSSSNQLRLVVVSAGRYEQPITDVTVSMEVIQPALIENKNTTNLETVIDQTPGVNVTDGQANIRGGSGFSYGAGSRVLLIVDDMPMLAGDAGDVKWAFLPIENVSQVEVLKGASSALFGASALNGVIHFRTAYAEPKPKTGITLFSGVYGSPSRSELKWWGNRVQTNAGLNFNHSRKVQNWDLVVGGHLFDDRGYRYDETEQRARLNGSLRYRFKKVNGLQVGLNTNMMQTKGGLFILWLNDSLAYIPADSMIQRYTSMRFIIDPFVTWFTDKNHRHTLRTRFFRTDNKNNMDQSSQADVWYGEYQYQHRFEKGLMLAAGLVGMHTIVRSELYKNHESDNIATYLQLEKRFFNRLTISTGIRTEYFRTDTVATKFRTAFGKNDSLELPFQPVFRFGLNYQITDQTFLRASYGQGYRFPSIAEKFVRTSTSGLEIYPNPDLQAETGQSAEIAIKRGITINKWNTFWDIALFWMAYKNMMEFTFGQWGTPFGLNPDPLFGLGFKSVNIGSTRVRGVDFSVVGQGTIQRVTINLLAGYTYMDPVSLTFDPARDTLANTSTENILKYRYRHLAKFDAELGWKKWSWGTSMRYNSFMENIDRFFEDALPEIKNYRINHNSGDIVFDTRLIWRINEKVRLNFICNNLLNREYVSRPADLQPPRNFTLQAQVKF
jgi:iron complex outermembrane receptor protein